MYYIYKIINKCFCLQNSFGNIYCLKNNRVHQTSLSTTAARGIHPSEFVTIIYKMLFSLCQTKITLIFHK